MFFNSHTTADTYQVVKVHGPLVLYSVLCMSINVTVILSDDDKEVVTIRPFKDDYVTIKHVVGSVIIMIGTYE